MKIWKRAEKHYTEYLSLNLWPAVRKSTGLRGEAVEDISWGPVSVEVKCRKSVPQYLWDWLIQAEKNRNGKIPMVLLHKDGERMNKGVAILSLEWLILLLNEIHSQKEVKDDA